MFGRLQRTTTNSRKIIFTALTIGVGFWLFETVLHEYLFDKQSFADMVLPGNVHELWMRSFVTFVIIGFGVYAQLIANRLNENRRRYQVLFENAPDAILLADIESSRIVDANPAACLLLRRQKAEVVGLHQSQLHPPTMIENSKRLFHDHLRQIGQGGNAPPVEHLLLRSDGMHIPVEIAAQIVTIQGKSVLQGIFRDITERKKAEDELRASEERLSEAQRVAQIGNWSWDLRTNQLYWSEENYRMFGLSEDVVPSYEAFIETLHPDDVEFVNTSVKNTLEKRAPYKIDYRIILPDGSERIIYTTGKVDYDEEGKPARFYGTIQDVTERRQHEERLRRSEEKYRMLFEHAGDYILVLEIPPNGVPIIRDANESALRMHGYTREEMIGQPISLVDSEAVEPAVAEERMRRLFNNETLTFEVKHRRKDGSEFDIEISSRAMRTSPSLLVVSIERDITERKKAEDAIRRQTKLLESIRHAQSLFIAGDDPKPVFDSLLETLVTITDSEYGFLDEVRQDDDGVLYKKSLAISNISWNEESRRLYEQLETSEMEFRNLSNLSGAPAAAGKLVISNRPAGDPRSGGLPKGHPALNSYMGIPVFFAGELVGVAGVANRPGGYDEQMAAFLETFIATCGAVIHSVRNERNKLQITSALKRSEERYRRIVEDQTEFLVRWLPDATRTFVNDSYCRYFGISKDQAIGTTFLPLIKEEYREIVINRIESTTPETPVSVRELEVCRSDGTTGWIQWTDRAIFDDQGKLLEFQSVGRDITDRKLAEDRQKLATHILELLNKPFDDVDTVRDVLSMVQEFTGIEAVGIRLRRCEDFVYYETNGFPDDFVEAEMQLCARESDGELIRDCEGKVRLECMCGNVICGRTDPCRPYFTEGGSFWTNSMTELLASGVQQELKAPLRGRCNTAGYESVALIPLHAEDEVIGLLQLNDHRAGMFTEESVRFFEEIGSSIGIAFKRKQAEESLRESEKRNYALFDDAAVAVWEEDFSQVKEYFDQLRSSGVSDFREYFIRHQDDVVRCAGMVRVINVNKESVQMLRADSKEELLLHLGDYFGSEQAWAVFREELSSLAEGQTHFQSEIPVRCQNGERLILDLRLSVLSGCESSLERVYVSFIDITGRKNAEYKLIKSEENYRSLYEGAPLGYQSLDSGGNFLDVNKEWLRTLGYSKEEVIGRCVAEFLAPEQEVSFAQKFPRFKSAGRVRGNEFEMLRKDGSRITVSFAGNIEYDAEGNFKRTHCIMHDITQRKRAEEKLRQESLMRETLLNNLPCVAMILKKGTREIVASNEAARKAGAVPGKTCFVTCADRQSICEFCLAPKVWEDGKARRKEVESRGRHFEGIWVPLTDELYVHYIFDITDRKEAEKSLQASEERLRILAETVEDVFWMSTPGIQEMIYVSPAYETIWGRSRESLYETPTSFMEVVHSEDRDRLVDIAKQYHALGKPYKCEYRIIPSEGRLRWISERGFPVLDEHGSLRCMTGVCTDVTERKQAEQALVESENKYRAVVQNAGEGIVVAQDGVLRFVNPRFTTITGYSHDELIARQFIDFIHPDDRDHMTDIHNRRLAGEDIPRAYELRIIDKHGNTRWLENNGILIEWGGRPASLNFLRDVTDRKKAEEAIHESEQRFRGIFENSLVGLYRTTPDGRIIMANPALARMLRYPSVEKLMELDLEEDGFEKPHERCDFKRLIGEHGQIAGLESAWKRSDGTTLFVRESSTAIHDSNGNVVYYEGTVEDITERKLAEKKLLDDRAQLKSLASQLSLTEERERRRLATDLHDHIGQSLVLSKIKLDLLRQSAAGELTGALEEVCAYLAQVIQDTRTLTFDLSSPILYELGIEAAIAEWLNDEINAKHGIATEFNDDKQDKPLTDDIRTILFRNVRELLINVVKHANARTVKVSIARAGEQVNVCVEDDGVGFDSEEVRTRAAKKAKFGLFSIKERLEQLGGQISIESSPGNGCRITMTAPLKKADTAASPYGI